MSLEAFIVCTITTPLVLFLGVWAWDKYRTGRTKTGLGATLTPETYSDMGEASRAPQSASQLPLESSDSGVHPGVMAAKVETERRVGT